MSIPSFKEINKFVTHSLTLAIKMLLKRILMLRGRHRKCVGIILLLTVIIIYLFFKCAIKDKTNCDVKKSDNKNPVILWWTLDYPGNTRTKICSQNIKCDIYSDGNASKSQNVDAYLFYGSHIDVEKLPLRKAEDVWGLYHEESPRNLEELMHESMLSLFNFSSTFSRYSDVPFPLQYLDSIKDVTSTKYFVPTSVKNKFLDEIAPIMYLQSDCATSTERDAYVKKLMEYITVDSYGNCLNNKELPKKFKGDYLNNLDEDEFLRFVAKYKFVIAIENGVCEDYVTEKFWRPIKVGVVPIYFGSPSIRDWFPHDKAAILLEDFPTPQILSEHLKKLLHNDTLYDEYLVHKTKQTITNTELVKEYLEKPYQSDGLVSAETFECFICEKLHRNLSMGLHIVNKSHYDCPMPISAISLSVNPSNYWVSSYKHAKWNAEQIKKRITNF